ncbi:MAG: potassium channel family protein [Methylobacter sp.]
MRFLLTVAEALNSFKNVLSDLKEKQSFVHLFILAVSVAIGSGLVLYLVDSGIRTPLDGIWSAWVTMTHVGFGDVVPASFFGRLLSALLILFGVILFSLFTATLSVILMNKDMKTWGMDVRQIEQETARIGTDETQILRELARLHERMTALEQQLPAKRGK